MEQQKQSLETVGQWHMEPLRATSVDAFVRNSPALPVLWRKLMAGHGDVAKGLLK
jgi:hypothetical protein